MYRNLKTRVNQNGMSFYKSYQQNVPKIPHDELERRLDKLFPFWFDKDSKFCFELEKRDPYGTSFVWERKEIFCLGELVGDVVCVREGDEEKLRQVFGSREYITYHTYGYHGFFKPTLAEVASFLPQELFDDAEKIYVTSEPLHMPGSDYPIGTNQGIHVARTTVLIRES